MSNNERAVYDILCRRGKLPALSYPEYMVAAREVVTEIPPEQITPIEEMLNRLEKRILRNRRDA